jgi:hypothetical protein
MQPYFFPYLGHFSLIAHTDYWVVFDSTQYTPKTWMNRNRILHPSTSWNYITVPLANSSISIKTYEAKILNIAETQKSILGKLSHYKRKAPYFEEVEAIVHRTFDAENDNSLVNLNVRGLKSVCEYLGLEFNFQLSSQLNFFQTPAFSAGHWALEICSLLGANEYVNPIGGRHLFDATDYQARGISLQFLDVTAFEYDTGTYEFEKNLSILDVLMWNKPNVVLNAIRDSSHIYYA